MIYVRTCSQTNSMLKSTCTMLENQVEELEIINEDFEEKQLQWNITRYWIVLRPRRCSARFRESTKTLTLIYFLFLQRGDLEQKREKIECELVENRRSLEQEKIGR